MYLSSFTFTVVLLPVVLLCYYFLPERCKNGFLLLCSLLVYGWGNPARLLYPAAFLCFDYAVGLLLERWKQRKAPSAAVLAFSVVLQAFVLIQVRYAEQVKTNFLFPFGIAVYTLLGLGYLIGIYRSRHAAETDPQKLALYLLFFPVLYAGPLTDYAEFRKQLTSRQRSLAGLSEGLATFIRGLALKVVLADTFRYVFRELRQPAEMSMLTAWLTTLAFSMYLYFELFGYAEMARGLGKCFGFSLPENFSQPFFAPSVTAYLQRWNMTLSLWFQKNFRHFLFHERRSRGFRYLGLVLMWGLIGAWYGSKPQFLLWGITIGLLLLLERLVLSSFIRKRYVIGMLYTGIVLQFAWVLLFAENMADAAQIWRAMLGFGNGIADQYGVYFFTSYIALLLLGLYIATDLFRNITERLMRPGKLQAVWKPLIHGGLLLFSLASMLYGERVTGLFLKL